MPRQMNISLQSIAEIVKNYNETIFKDNCIVVGPSHTVWKNIRNDLKNEISEKSLYTLVKCNRNNFLNLLGIKKTEEHKKQIKNYFQRDSVSSTSKDSSTDDVEETLKFNITLSIEEWNRMLPSEVKYKRKGSTSRTYTILSPGIWTDIIHSHFWEQTKRSCSIVYKRAKIYEDGTNYCQLFGTCSNCSSKFFGVLKNKPPTNCRAIFQCTYQGGFSECSSIKKKYMSSKRKKYFLEKIVQGKLSAITTRRLEADKIMNFGDNEPSHLPTSNALRIAKCRELKKSREDNDPILSICKMKNVHPYTNVIKDIGYDRFFVHYWSSTEINIYRKYVMNNKICSTICIDATGSLIKKPLLHSNRNTKHILLYEIAIHDKALNTQYSVSHMLSERHDNNSIHHWLVEWIRDGAPKPKQVVTDMSLALMSAVVKAFTQFNTIYDYIESCFKFLCSDESNLPQCFIRCDVAHVIKLVINWTIFRTVDVRIKDFIVRVIGQIVLSRNYDDVQNLLKHLFWLIYGKTDGTMDNNENTYAKNGMDFLRQRIATGFVDQYMTRTLENDFTDEYDSEDNQSPEEPILNNVETTLGTHKKGPFYKMAKDLALKCQQVENQNGNHDNLYFLPNIVPLILNICTYLPLWSGIMCKSFKYGDIPPSSAAIESQFNDLKHRVLKHVDFIPMRVDDFLKVHIESINGSMKLIHAKIKSQQLLYNQIPIDDKPLIIDELVHLGKSPIHVQSTSCSNKSPISTQSPYDDQSSLKGCNSIISYETTNSNNSSTIKNPIIIEPFINYTNDNESLTNSEQSPIIDQNSSKTSKQPCYDLVSSDNELLDLVLSPIKQHNPSINKCVPCAAGDLPTGSHKCIRCFKNVHIISGCSTSIGNEEGYGEKRICDSCYPKEYIQDNYGQRKRKLKNNTSGLYEAPHLENEDNEEENWKNINGGNFSKKKSIYLTPNREILLRNLNSRSKTKVIGLIKNGNKSNLMSVMLNGHNYVLSNTCAFDSIIQLLAVAYCDSTEYSKYVLDKKESNTLWHLVFALLRDGVTVQTYRKRAKILINLFPGESMTNGITFLSVEQAADNLLNKLLPQDPCIKINKKCNNCSHKETVTQNYLTICVKDKNPTKRQLDYLLNEEIRLIKKSTVCKQCSEDINLSLTFGNHLFFNLINLNNSASNLFTDTKIQLNNIPKCIKINETEFILRGSVTTPDQQQNVVSHTYLGHYHAHAYRHPINIWQLYDDLRDKVILIKDTTKVNIQILMYSK